MTLSLEQARGGHGTLPMTTVDSQGSTWYGAGRGHDAAELHVPRTGDVPTRPLVRLADIEGRALHLLVDLANSNCRHGQSRRLPRVHAALKLAGQVFVADLQAL